MQQNIGVSTEGAAAGWFAGTRDLAIPDISASVPWPVELGGMVPVDRIDGETEKEQMLDEFLRRFNKSTPGRCQNC